MVDRRTSTEHRIGGWPMQGVRLPAAPSAWWNAWTAATLQVLAFIPFSSTCRVATRCWARSSRGGCARRRRRRIS